MNLGCGSYHSIVLDNEGFVWVFGSNKKGQLGLDNDNIKQIEPKRNEFLNNIIQVACLEEGTICLDGNNKVWAFGKNYLGSLGLSECKYYIKPEQIPNLVNINYITCGFSHTIAINDSRQVYSFGLNNNGQLGLNDIKNRFEPTLIPDMNNIIEGTCGAFHTFLIDSDFNAYSFGRNTYGQLALRNTSRVRKPVKVPVFNDTITSISCGADHTVILLENNEIYVVGCNESGQLGLGSTVNKKSPVKLNIVPIKKISCGYNHTLCIDEDDSLWIFGCYTSSKGHNAQYTYNASGNSKTLPNKLHVNEKIYDVSRGGAHTFVKGMMGSVWAFGDNDLGQLGTCESTTKTCGVTLRKLPEDLAHLLWHQRTQAKSARK